MKNSSFGAYLLFLLVFATLAYCLDEKLQACQPSGKIRGIKPPPGQSVLTVNSFQKGGDGGGPSEFDNQYHSDDTPVVALSTEWYSGGDRCLNYITISANSRSVEAKVVDEFDSTMDYDEDHDYQPPCPNNIIDASKAVWKSLGVLRRNFDF
ncbi:hypothetical protein P3S67_025989 [Capsicum chacoense]